MTALHLPPAPSSYSQDDEQQTRRLITDAVAGPSSGGSSVTLAAGTIHQVEVDFGSTPVADGTFLVSDGNVTIYNHLIAAVAYEAPTSKDLDELEMDRFTVIAAPGAGNYTLFMSTADGSYLADKFKVNVLIG